MGDSLVEGTSSVLLDEVASKTIHKDRASSYGGNISKTLSGVKPVKNINKKCSCHLYKQFVKNVGKFN